MNRPLFPKTLLISSYDMGKYVGLRTYKHPLVLEDILFKLSFNDGQKWY